MKIFSNLLDLIAHSPRSEGIVYYKRTPFPLFVDYKGSDKWVLFFPGACKRNRPIPVFQRSSYSQSIEANVISFFDPGLMLHKNLQNTWFSGTPSRYYAQHVADFLCESFKKKGVANKNVLLCGTSAGGLPALKVAQSLSGSKVWLGNIQVNASKHSAFPRMVDILYPGHSVEGCFEKFLERFDATLMDGQYTIYYFQNRSDFYHYKNHYQVYRKWYFNNSHKVECRFYEYEDSATGHGSVGREKEILIINKIINSDSLSIDWANEV